MKNDPDLEARLKDIISHGLVSGLGVPRPGALCVEAAICLALGEPHSDQPSCVAGPDREFAIRLNDAEWSSSMTRAEALLPLALAQLGTAGTDRSAWVRHVTTGTIRRVLPMALRAAASTHPDAKHRDALEAAAVRCEQAPDAAAARAASYAASADDAAAANAARAASNAAYAAYAASNAAYAAYAATTDAAAYAADAAADAARAAARAADAAASAYTDRDAVFKVAVEVALEAYAAERT